MSSFILKNGKFVAADEKLFQYSDFETLLFSEKIRAIRNVFPFFEETVDLLLLKFRLLNQAVPDILSVNGRELKRQSERLLTKNKLFKSAVVQLSFFRNGDDTGYIFSARSMDSTGFELNKKGLLVEVFDKMAKPVSELSCLSFGSDALWKIASGYLHGSDSDEFLIINSEGKIIEGIGRKLFMIKGDQLYGVSPSAGAYMDVAGSLVAPVAEKAGLAYSECNGFTSDQILQADELFFLDAVRGAQWILGFREKRFYNVKTRLINEELYRFKCL